MWPGPSTGYFCTEDLRGAGPVQEIFVQEICVALAQYRMAAEREKRQAGGGQEENGDAPEHLFLRSGAGNKQ